MIINDEINNFDDQCNLLLGFIEDLAKVNKDDITQQHLFLAEAVTFRIFRVYERFVRACFLESCVNTKTLSGKEITSKLICPDWGTAEDILKSGNKFLDWGNVDTVRKISNLIHKDGFPILDLINPFNSTLKDLQRFRNFVAHDSDEAAQGFRMSRTQYLKVGDLPPETVGELALYRRNTRADITIKLIHDKIKNMSLNYRAL